jgi:hypothetical protein
MDKHNTDKHRYRYSGGVKAVETEKWGRATARERYGSAQSGNMRPKDESQPQSPENKHGPGYANDTSGWLRAAGERGRPKR